MTPAPLRYRCPDDDGSGRHKVVVVHSPARLDAVTCGCGCRFVCWLDAEAVSPEGVAAHDRDGAPR